MKLRSVAAFSVALALPAEVGADIDSLPQKDPATIRREIRDVCATVQGLDDALKRIICLRQNINAHQEDLDRVLEQLLRELESATDAGAYVGGALVAISKAGVVLNNPKATVYQKYDALGFAIGSISEVVDCREFQVYLKKVRATMCEIVPRSETCTQIGEHAKGRRDQ